VHFVQLPYLSLIAPPHAFDAGWSKQRNRAPQRPKHFPIAARRFGPRGTGKNIPRGGEGAPKLMRCSNKVKKNLLKKPMKSSVLACNSDLEARG
jgi:hypothetical protein